jgi:hypothetical protein
MSTIGPIVSKTLIFLKLVSSKGDSIHLKCFLYDGISKSINEANCEKLFGKFKEFRCLDSIINDSSNSNFSELEQNFFNYDIFMNNKTKNNVDNIKLNNLNLLDFNIKITNGTLEIDGSCVLNISNESSSFIFYLNNGNIMTKTSSNYVYNHISIANINQYEQVQSSYNFNSSSTNL